MRRKGIHLLVVLVVAIANMYGASRPAYGQAQTEIIPSVSVSERYDSNVFFTSAKTDSSDYVTTISPMVNIRRDTRLIDLSGSLQVSGNFYVKNPSLNYASVLVNMNASLDSLVARFVKRTTLAVNEFLTYTPQPPAFYAPPISGAGAGGPENFARGIQAVRANSFINVFAMNGAYVVDPNINIVGSIRHQYMRFGSAFATPVGGGFFNTQYFNASVGPQFVVTTKDRISVNANYSAIAYAASGFQLAGATLGWQHKLSQRFSFNVNGGVTKFLTGGQSLQYVGSGQFTWQERSTATSVSVSRSVFPSFYVTSTALVSNVITLSVTHQFTERLTGSASGNYAKNQSVSGPSLDFTSYSGAANLNYLFTKRVIGTASYTRFVTNSSFSGQGFSFNRDIFVLTVRYEWR
ncbi:MAG TPA: outer membrane beta-barrel protein [Nitrospiraceae bacterium]|nr:outer membrane beta-barrel protein [Nitrospiraceae bacterium]